MKNLAVVLVAIMASAATFGADFAIVKDGEACARVEFGAMPDEKTRESAEKDVSLFNTYLKEVAGAALTMSCRPAQPKSPDLKMPNLMKIDILPITNLTTRFEWRIGFPSPSEMRIEATSTSLFTALRQIIEEGCDARFLGTERCMFQFEPRSDVSIAVRPRRNARHNFSLLRDVYGAKGHRRELGVSDDELFKYSHGVPVFAFPADKYRASGWPEAIMPVWKGKRFKGPPSSLYCFWQPCYSSPETARIATENILEFLRAHPGTRSVTLGVNDLGGYCDCERCTAMDADAERPSAFTNDHYGNRSASYYTFVNRVAKAVCAEFPDLRIGLLAYTGTVMPPKFAIHPNVVPVITLDVHSAGMDESVRSRQENVIRRWGQKVPEIGMWDYSWGGGYFIPRVNFSNRAARLKFLYANGGRAYFGENSMPDALDGPKTYLTARLLEDVDADPDVILKEWFTRYAGAAAEKPLREIYRECTDYWVSDSVRKSPIWAGRTYIYNAPSASQFYALTPGFTKRLLGLAREVRRLASTSGEKARAEVLLRHFARLDCVATFRGSAYMSPSSGELVKAADAAKMLEYFADRAAELFSEWELVRRYFLNAPDFDNPKVYMGGGRDVGVYELVPLLAEQFGKASLFLGDPSVVAAFDRVRKLPCLPSDARAVLDCVSGGTAENCFSNPGFAKALDESRIQTTLPHEVVDDAHLAGRSIRLWPGRPDGEPDPADNLLRQTAAFSFVENLKPGTYLATVIVRSEAHGTSGDLSVWRHVDGKSLEWETMHSSPLRKGRWHTFVQVRTVKDTDDGLIVKLRLNGFGRDDELHIGEVKLIRIADVVASGRAKSVAASGFALRGGAKRTLVRGEDAVVPGQVAGPFAHVWVNVPRILPDERIEFNLCATQADGAKAGRLGVILYDYRDGDWRPQHQELWDRKPAAGRWEEMSFSLSGAQLGKKKGKFLLILFRMEGPDAVAVSHLSWKVSSDEK